MLVRNKTHIKHATKRNITCQPKPKLKKKGFLKQKREGGRENHKLRTGLIHRQIRILVGMNQKGTIAIRHIKNIEINCFDRPIENVGASPCPGESQKLNGSDAQNYH